AKPIDPGNLFETVGKYYKPPPEMTPGKEDSKRPSERPLTNDADNIPTANGLETIEGIARVGGNRKLYLKLLRQFVDQQGTAPGQICDALKQGDVALAERLA